MARSIEVKPINGCIGAEIRGADLGRLDDSGFQVIHDALVAHGVIVLRDQDITLEQQMAFGRRFGPLVVHPFSPNLDDKPEVIVLDYGADNPPALTDIWHADETYRAAPPMATMLRARVVPEIGGDTVFASMTAAYQGLSSRMQHYIHGLEALHDFKPFRSLFTRSEAHRRKLWEIEEQFPNPWHPVVRVHPVSGRRVLYVNPQFAIRIKGVSDDESQTILQFLFRQAQIPEYQLRVKWRPDTVVMWDNRSVQHYAPHDYYPQRRTMERVTIAGDAPVGATGAYAPEAGVAPLPNGKTAPRSSKRPIRQFERA
jgi:taurine dioxygenase